MELTDELNELKKKKDSYKEKKQQSTGKLETLYKQLNDYGCKSLDEAKEKASKIINQNVKDQVTLADGIKEIREFLNGKSI